MNDSKVLIINDVTGYGRVSTFAMLPVMAQYGIHPYVLPTALVSNTTDYGSCEILDTSEFMKSTIEKWSEFGFKFSNICTGLLNSKEQVEIILKFIEDEAPSFVLQDPIMADDGKLYDGIYEGVIECNRQLASKANLIIPNITEAELLTGKYTGRDVLEDEEYADLIESIRKLGPEDVIISGCASDDGKRFNLVFDHKTGSAEKVFYEHIPVKFTGTGDIFSACVMSELLNGNKLVEAVDKASSFIRKVITDNSDNNDHYDLIIEKSLNMLK